MKNGEVRSDSRMDAPGLFSADFGKPTEERVGEACSLWDVGHLRRIRTVRVIVGVATENGSFIVSFATVVTQDRSL